MAEEVGEPIVDTAQVSEDAQEALSVEFADEMLAQETAGVAEATHTTEEIEDMQAEITRLTERTQLVDQFEANPQAVLRSVAERLGMALVPAQTNGNGNQAQDNSSPPQSYTDTVTSSLPSEMQFMGDSIARATWAANQESLRPFQEQQRASNERASLAERNAIAAEMDASNPGWRDKVGEMEERYTFIRDAVNGGAMKHPKFGSLQQMLLALVAGENGAVNTAVSRINSAGRNATSRSDNQSTAPVDIAKLIKDASSGQDKFDIAFRAAMAEHGVSG